MGAVGVCADWLGAARPTLDARARPTGVGQGRERVVSVSPETNRGDGVARSTKLRASWGRSRPGAGAVAACHYPAGERGRIGADRVVTGAKIGLRANGCKEIANRNLRAALVTGVVWCRHPRSCHWQRGRLKPTWAPKGAIRCRYRDHRDVSRADAPPQARRATPNRRRARSTQTARRLPRGFLWPRGDPGEPPGIA